MRALRFQRVTPLPQILALLFQKANRLSRLAEALP
jgi:hypothetical protein